MVVRAVLAPFVAGSGSETNCRSLGCAKDLSPVEEEAGTTLFGGEQYQARVCRVMEREERIRWMLLGERKISPKIKTKIFFS